MGIRDLFSRKTAGLRSVSSPSAEFSTPRSAIEGILTAHPNVGQNEDWITFMAENGEQCARVEVTGDQVNFCKKRIDLAAVLAAAGLSALAHRVRPGGRKHDDLTLWTVEAPTLDERINIVDACLTKALGMGNSYRLVAEYVQA